LYPDPAGQGGTIDYCIMLLSEILFSGKMRGLFALIFGVSATLFVEKLCQKHENIRVVSIYYQRLLWLGVFGLVNAYIFLWWGDILFQYALLGIVLFPLIFANWRVLVGMALTCLALLVLQPALEHRDMLRLEKAYQEVQTTHQAGRPLASEDADIVMAWRDAEADRRPDPEYIAEDISARSNDYVTVFLKNSEIAFDEQTILFVKDGVADISLYMLLGILLAKTVFLGSVHLKRMYLAFSVGALLFGLIVQAWVNLGYFNNYFDPVTSSFYMIFFDLGRLPLVIGYLMLILMVFDRLNTGCIGRALGATGRMALTNYLTQSIIGAFVFNGFGLAQFNALSRLELVAVMFSVLAFQIAFSVIWMHIFYHGPFEWLWRTLTYWEAQPLLRGHCQRKPP